MTKERTETKIDELRNAIKKSDELSEKLSTAKAILLAKFTEDNKSDMDTLSALYTVIDDLKAIIGNEAVANFNATGAKQFLSGIAVKEYTKVKYDPVLALTYAKQKDLFLELDTKAFEKAVIAKTITPEFAIIVKEPKATFPSKL